MEPNPQSPANKTTEIVRDSYPSIITIKMPPMDSIKQLILTEPKETNGNIKENIPFEWQGLKGNIQTFGANMPDENIPLDIGHLHFNTNSLSIFPSIKSNEHIIENGMIITISLESLLPDYENFLSSHDTDNEKAWTLQDHENEPLPEMVFRLKESSKHKQTLKERAAEAVSKHVRDGGISADDANMLPDDLKEKLESDVQKKLEETKK